MPLLVIGGQASKVGKTSVVVAILTRFREFQWTAVKTTSHLHQPAHCELVALADDWRIWKQISASSDNDTARFLAAGAKTALLLEAEDEAMPMAAAALQREIATCTHVVIESSRIVDFIQPDLFLMLLSAPGDQCKASVKERVQRADILLLQGARTNLPPDLQAAMKHKPTFDFLIPIREDESWINAVAAKIGAGS